MKRMTTFAVAALMLLVLAVPASAQEAMPKHGHILLLHVQYENGAPVGFGKCIDVAGGRQNSHAHHSTIHRGRAGQALGQAGHMVAPTHPLIPEVYNCADFAEALAAGELG